jgi:hypothetical protein
MVEVREQWFGILTGALVLAVIGLGLSGYVRHTRYIARTPKPSHAELRNALEQVESVFGLEAAQPVELLDKGMYMSADHAIRSWRPTASQLDAALQQMAATGWKKVMEEPDRLRFCRKGLVAQVDLPDGTGTQLAAVQWGTGDGLCSDLD